MGISAGIFGGFADVVADAGIGTGLADAAAFSLPEATAAGIEGGIADASLAGAAGAAAGGEALAGAASDFALPSATAEGIDAGISAATPGLYAPVDAGLTDAATAATATSPLAPSAGALAPAASPAVSGISSVASNVAPALAESTDIPLTEAATQGAEQLGTQAATQGAEQLGTQAATQGAEQLGTQAATQAATQTGETGLSQLAPGTQQIINDAAPLTSEAGTQTALATGQTAAQGAGQAAAQGAGQAALQSAPSFAQPAVQQVVQNLAQSELPLAPVQSALAPATDISSALTSSLPASALSQPIDLTTATASGGAVANAAAQAGGEGLLGQAGSYLAKNSTSVLSALGLAANMLKGNQMPKYSGQLSAEAAQLQAQGAQLQGYLTSGTLPPGVGASLSAAHDSVAATIRSQYAARGMSGSSAEMQDLNNLAQTTVTQGAQIASNLLATGVSEQQFASGLYQNLMATSMQQDTNMSNAIAGFTNAMANSAARTAATPTPTP